MAEPYWTGFVLLRELCKLKDFAKEWEGKRYQLKRSHRTVQGMEVFVGGSSLRKELEGKRRL